MHKAAIKLLRWGKFLPPVVLYQSFGCLPEDAFPQVFAENIIFTSAVVIQTLTSTFFNSLFGLV